MILGPHKGTYKEKGWVEVPSLFRSKRAVRGP